MKKILLVATIMSLPFIATGCASITQGTSQTLTFKLDPKETKCVLTRVDDGELGSISSKSNTIQVHKDKDDIVVQCSASGFEQKTSRIVSKATTAGVTGVMLDFGITDMMTGAMYAYPTEISIVMGEESVASNDAQQVKSAISSTRMTVEEKEQKLGELKLLKEKGLISQEVYTAKQNEILNTL